MFLLPCERLTVLGAHGRDPCAPLHPGHLGGQDMATLDELSDILRQRLKEIRGAKRLFAHDPTLAAQVARAIASAPLFAGC